MGGGDAEAVDAGIPEDGGAPGAGAGPRFRLHRAGDSNKEAVRGW